jgi:hypothetical protein
MMMSKTTCCRSVYRLPIAALPRPLKLDHPQAAAQHIGGSLAPLDMGQSWLMVVCESAHHRMPLCIALHHLWLRAAALR